MAPKNLRYRWVAPDGRRGRWRKTVEGALMSAVATARSSPPALRVNFDLVSSLALWPTLEVEGWRLVKERPGNEP